MYKIDLKKLELVRLLDIRKLIYKEVSMEEIQSDFVFVYFLLFSMRGVLSYPVLSRHATTSFQVPS
jgi:hypothetical protein